MLRNIAASTPSSAVKVHHRTDARRQPQRMYLRRSQLPMPLRVFTVLTVIMFACTPIMRFLQAKRFVSPIIEAMGRFLEAMGMNRFTSARGFGVIGCASLASRHLGGSYLCRGKPDGKELEAVKTGGGTAWEESIPPIDGGVGANDRKDECRFSVETDSKASS